MASRKFLQDKQVSVDIFAISPAGTKGRSSNAADTPKQELSTTFAVGEEADISLPKRPGG